MKNAEQDCIDNSGVKGEVSEVTDETDSDSDSDWPGHCNGPSGIKLCLDLRCLTTVCVDNQSAEGSSCNNQENEGLGQNMPDLEA